MSGVSNTDLPNSRTGRQLARLGADFASIDANNIHVTHGQARREYKTNINDVKPASTLKPIENASDSFLNWIKLTIRFMILT